VDDRLASPQDGRRQLVLNSFEDSELRLELTELAAHRVHKVPTYHFRILKASGEEVGSINLRVSSSAHIELYAGHVGFAVHPAYRGHRYASRALLLLMPFARELRLDPLWVTCDPDNFPSRRSCERAGAKLVEIVDVPEDCIVRQSGHPRKCRYRLDLAGVASRRDDSRVNSGASSNSAH
jgi:tagatose 1,6-diphosphate aldolase